ncbi:MULTISPECIES: DUF4870 domain-containing protein [Microbacterium]|uniref:DUF4870 domain-containing protein n=1 Tax=Microbacterium TaxID=33882 RepID=UPI00217E64E9|nr:MULTISPECIES: DUF4870 domain-containing protein [Microbacterium]UWF78136.1 DUF4870 domain-containing protein [Microbacterium neungamense]WCM56313.1 DUF4870 domain-containing protein [Microbacterium sp. EF45047]
MTARPATGASAWALGLLVLLPVPFLGSLASGGAMVAAYGSLSRQGPLAKANADAARRWGRLFLLVSTALLVVHLAITLPRLFLSAGSAGFLPQGIPILLYIAVCVVHLVVVIVATVRASKGEVVRLPFGRRG